MPIFKQQITLEKKGGGRFSPQAGPKRSPPGGAGPKWAPKSPQRCGYFGRGPGEDQGLLDCSILHLNAQKRNLDDYGMTVQTCLLLHDIHRKNKSFPANEYQQWSRGIINDTSLTETCQVPQPTPRSPLGPPPRNTWRGTGCKRMMI